MRCAALHHMWVQCGCIQGPVAGFDPVVSRVISVPPGLSVSADNEPF